MRRLKAVAAIPAVPSHGSGTDGGTAPAATFGGAVAQGEEVLKSVAGKGGELDDALSTTEATSKMDSLSVTSPCWQATSKSTQITTQSRLLNPLTDIILRQMASYYVFARNCWTI